VLIRGPVWLVPRGVLLVLLIVPILVKGVVEDLVLNLQRLRRLLEVSVKRDHIFHQAVQELLVLFHPKWVQREVQGIR